MSEFGDLEKKAKAYAEEQFVHLLPEGQFAERDTDHQHDEQIDRAVDAAEQHIGKGQDQQGNQN